MKLLNWLRRRGTAQPSRTVIVELPPVDLTTRIVVPKVMPRTDLPEFCVESFAEIVDLRPLAAEVLADQPVSVAIDVETLARLCVKGFAGRYIRVAEYPPGVDREAVKRMIWRVTRWEAWPRRSAQAQRTAGAFPKRLFRCSEDCCPGARAMDGLVVPVNEVVRLPLKECWDHRCECDYRLVKRDGSVV